MADALAEQRERNEKRALAEAAAKLDAAKAQRDAIIGVHLKALEHEQAEDAQMLNLVVQKAIEQTGLPIDDTARKTFIENSEALAYSLTARRRLREAEQMKAMLDSLNARTPNEVMVATAKRAGVELSVATEASKLVVG